MIVHFLALGALFVSATALLLASLSLPPDDTVIVTQPSTLPSSVSSPAASQSPDPELSQDPVASSDPVASASPDPAASQSPDPKTTPVPSPSPTASELPSFGIAATSPETVLREAQVHAGRLDPFKSVYPPNLPEFEPAVNPESLALPPLPDLPVASVPPSVIIDSSPAPQETPLPPDPIEKGLVLKGIMDGGIDPVAIIEVDGQTELLRVGERLRGGILVTAIHYENRRVNLSRGRETGVLIIPKPISETF